MKNRDIRRLIEETGLRYWQIADRLGMTDGNFSRKLRHELPDAEKQKIFEAIERLSSEREVS